MQAAQIAATISTILARDAGDNEDPRTEIYSRANMVVLGSHAFIFESTNRTCNVQPFDPSLGTASTIPIVDGGVVYKCKYTGEIYVLIVKNTLHIPHFRNNLIPSFVMRAAGIAPNDTPKIHSKDPKIDDHCITFKESDNNTTAAIRSLFVFSHKKANIVGTT